jgi:hypothetical protein
MTDSTTITVELTSKEAEELIYAVYTMDDRTHGRVTASGSALKSAWDKLIRARREAESLTRLAGDEEDTR